jgi:hypothetical protein
MRKMEVWLQFYMYAFSFIVIVYEFYLMLDKCIASVSELSE